MSDKSYYVTRSKKKKETQYLELEKLDGYKVKPKVKEKDAIGVSKIIFVNDDFSEKIIRKKINNKIEYLLKQLKLIDEESGTDNGTIQKNLMEAEKLRVQIINNYVKYLGHTYQSLTLRKIELIIEELRYKLYVREFNKFNLFKQTDYSEEKESKRGR